MNVWGKDQRQGKGGIKADRRETIIGNRKGTEDSTD